MGVTPDHVTVAASVVAHVVDSVGWINYWWVTSEAVWKFIRDYDAGDLTLKPRSFILNPGPFPADQASALPF